jgi:rare lipoprotein A (peptidoglycan hydrolase)
MGVAHPVLPCGAKIVLEYDDTRVLTQVIDRGPSVPGREFDISRPLALRLRLQGVQPIRWQFAR